MTRRWASGSYVNLPSCCLTLWCASDFLAGFSRRTVTGSSILSRSNDPVPVETRLHRDAAPGGSYETSRHRAGRRRLSAPLLCRWRFTCEPARAASVGALGHGRLPGSYEELVAARVGR